MKKIEINMLEMLIDRIMDELGNDARLYRTIEVEINVYYVIAGSEDYLHLYKISTNYPSINEFDGVVLEDF